MKALLRKDIYVLFKQMRFLLLILILFCTLPTLSATAFSMIFVIMLPVTTMGYDERSKWVQLAVMMPYTTRQLVVSKYLLGYLGAGITTVFSVASKVIFSLMNNQPLTFDVLESLLIFPCVGLLLLSVNLPLMFRFGTEKGRIGYILTVAVLSASAALIPREPTFSLTLTPPIIALVLVTILCNLLSIRISTRIFRANP